MNNLTSEQLIEEALLNNEGTLSVHGALVTTTGSCTGRSPNAKAIVYDQITAGAIDWGNNSKVSTQEFRDLAEKFIFYKGGRKTYAQDVWAVRDERYSIPIRIHTKQAKHSLFVRNMFIPHDSRARTGFSPQWELFQFPGLSNDPRVWISFEDKQILISGTNYSGEIKKSVFTVLNFLFPQTEDLPMHCSVNVDKDRKNAAIFFGLSGTGKTTLSSDENRVLIGDDEHAWTDSGLTNFEGGCYAKTINLSKEDEPQIYQACHRRGTILENVVTNNGVPDFFDSSITQNGRASYPTSFISGADDAGFVDVHPSNIIMLTCDAFGVLPPVMKLTPEEAVNQFLLGYTAKVAGTESGVNEPKATFSPCFGAPFMPLPPGEYGKILMSKIKKHKPNCWLVNTGWTGGPYGVGKRMPISVTRSIIDMIHSGELASLPTLTHDFTGFEMPVVDEDVIPTETMFPELGWNSLPEYRQKVDALMKEFDSRLHN